jgi:hypothetical protein
MDDKDPDSTSGDSSGSGDNDKWTKDFGDLLKHLCDDGGSSSWSPPDCSGSTATASASDGSDDDGPITTPCNFVSSDGGSSSGSDTTNGAMTISDGSDVAASMVDGVQSVPEPVSTGLLVAASMGCVIRRRRR